MSSTPKSSKKATPARGRASAKKEEPEKVATTPKPAEKSAPRSRSRTPAKTPKSSAKKPTAKKTPKKTPAKSPAKSPAKGEASPRTPSRKASLPKQSTMAETAAAGKGFLEESGSKIPTHPKGTRASSSAKKSRRGKST